MTRLDQITRSVSDNTGLSQSQVARIAFGASARLGFNAGVGGAQVDATGDKAFMSGLSGEQKKALGSLTSEQLAEFKQFGERMSRDAALVSAISDDARQSRELGSRISAANSRSERPQAMYGEKSALMERLSSARERGESISIDIAQDPYNLDMFMRFAERYGGDSAAALSLLDSELARQSLRPTRVVSDGSALPMSFKALRSKFERSRSEPALNPDISASSARDRGTVIGTSLPLPASTTTPAGPSMRPEIRAKGAELRRQAEQTREGFEARSEIVREPDGTISTKKSLMIQSDRQVAADAGATLDEAKAAVKKALKPK